MPYETESADRIYLPQAPRSVVFSHPLGPTDLSVADLNSSDPSHNAKVLSSECFVKKEPLRADLSPATSLARAADQDDAALDAIFWYQVDDPVAAGHNSSSTLTTSSK